MPELDTLLDRITYRHEAPALAPIPWPSGLAPTPLHTELHDGALPPGVDVLVITWTAAEAQALAAVLTPGVSSDEWTHYRNGWAAYEHQLTGRSPARESRRLGSFHMTKIGDQVVCCFKSELHPATDGPTLPTAQLAAQIAHETGAELVITTGTAGGAGAGTVLGDVNVATAVHADFTTRLKGHPWSQQQWPTVALNSKQEALLDPWALGPLLAPNAAQLPAQWAPRAPQAWLGHTVSTDFFAFASDDDHYGLYAYDPQIKAVEMDDAAVALGVLGLENPPTFASARNASDPIMKDASEASAREAEQIYRKYGYWTTVSSAVCCWALIAGL